MRKSLVLNVFRRQMIELIGISLSNALLHVRVEESAQALNILGKKVQHRLRTPDTVTWYSTRGRGYYGYPTLCPRKV